MKLKSVDRKRFRIRNKGKKVSSLDRLRLSISRSTNNISAQIIDDTKNITLVSCSSVEKDFNLWTKLTKLNFLKLLLKS